MQEPPHVFGMYLCGNCHEEVKDPPIEEWREPDGTDQGYHWESEPVCPSCRSNELIPAHYCHNPNCLNYAEEDKLLCDSCFRDFVRKYLAFMSSLSNAELDVLNSITDGEALDEVAESLRRSDEWQRSRL